MEGIPYDTSTPRLQAVHYIRHRARHVPLPENAHGRPDLNGRYNFRFDKVTEKVENLKRCVDDSLLHAKTLEEAFFRTAEYLSLMGLNGIPQNPDKFQFGTKTVEWAGFLIGEKSVKPLKKHTDAIKCFPTVLAIGKITRLGCFRVKTL